MSRLNNPLTQVIILGFVCFCCPGMFNALSGTGAYGLDSKDNDVATNAGIALSLVFAFSSLFAGALFNILGHRILLILGGLTYVLYVASFMAYQSIKSMPFVVVASCLLGVGAGWLWCAQGAIMMGYPAENEKGRFFSLFWSIFNLGGVLGNLIPLIAQWNDEKALSASTATYIGFMVVMAAGAFLSILILPASKVVRNDGSTVTAIKYSSPILELKAIFALFKDWRMLCLIPMFFSSNWVYTYQFNAVNAPNFNIRTRSFNSAFYWGAQIVASIGFGAFMDKSSKLRTTRARWSLVLMTLVLIATWAGGIAFQSGIGPRNPIIDPETGKYIKNPKDFHVDIDLVKDTSRWIGPFILYFMYGVVDAMYQGYSYWLMGALTNDTNTAARFAGFYKFIQNLGGVLAPVVQQSTIGNGPTAGSHAQNVTSAGMGEIIVAIVLVLVGCIGAIPVAWKAVQETTEDETAAHQTEKEEVGDVKA
ncbi:hypothetical protein BGZ73_005943 [Actinomortierella ambigua]|nr:hypothetical protein BGZ73_005943 [Actinomortierella ambigua]